MAFERCVICGSRSAHVVAAPAKFLGQAGVFIELPDNRHMKCNACGETYYTGPQWIRTDLALQATPAYVIGDVVGKGPSGRTLVPTSSGTLSAAIFYDMAVKPQLSWWGSPEKPKKHATGDDVVAGVKHYA